MNRNVLLCILILSLVGLACSTSLLAAPTPEPTATAEGPALSGPPATASPVLIVPSATGLIPSPSATVPPAPATSTSGAPSGGGIIPGSPSGPYAIVLVQLGDVLNIRSGAGVGFGVVGSFSPSATGVMRTGPSSRVGDDLWVEVQNPSGGTGWVNAHFLTEYVTSAVFCADPKVTTLLGAFKSAVLNENGESLASLVSPVHGLDVRFFRYVDAVNYDQEHVEFVFETNFIINWGPQPGSGEDLKGAFHDVIIPALQSVLSAGTTSNFCNQIKTGGATYNPEWPYPNVNFHSIHFPGTDAYGGLDWETWLVGVEYVGGQPYLFALIHLDWEP